MRILNQTVSYTVGTINNLPFIYDHEYSERIVSLARENIQISKDDWDSSETSWGFKASQLLNRGQNLRAVTEDWISECRLKASIIQKNEEELNRLFINIYGLDKELSPEIREEDITLTVPNAESIIKDLLSYAVGCMFGRYGLQKSGIIYAGGQWDINQYSLFLPDEDNVIPITDEEYLEDDIVSRFCDWMKKVFGEDSLEDNLDYIASIIGGKGDSSRERIRHYFVTSFYKDHCDKYSATGSGRRPIYWLFDSGKQNGFKALIYLHRYNADTIGNLRIDYLHRMQRVYESEISRMQDMIDHSTNAREVGQATKRRDKLTKQLKECREYDEKLAHLALSRIKLDLDDGVKVNYRKLQTANDGKFYEVLADSKNIMAKK